MKLAFIVLSFFIAGFANAQTCIIVYVSGKGITAGADRKYQQTLASTDTVTGKQQKSRSVYYGKKIFTDKNGYWAFSGADYYDTIHAICKEVIARKGSLQQIVTRFEKRLQAQTVKKAMHDLFVISDEKQKMKFKGNFAEVAFFKFDGNNYKCYRVTISMPGIFNSDERLHLETDSVVAGSRTVGVFVLGHSTAFGNNIHPEKWTDPAGTIRKLIRQQAKLTPDDVSTASNVIRITKEEFTWVAPR